MIYPALATNRVISQKTNLVESRPWWLAKGTITANSVCVPANSKCNNTINGY